MDEKKTGRIVKVAGPVVVAEGMAGVREGEEPVVAVVCVQSLVEQPDALCVPVGHLTDHEAVARGKRHLSRLEPQAWPGARRIDPIDRLHAVIVSVRGIGVAVM